MAVRALFCAAIKRDSVSLSNFSFLQYVLFTSYCCFSPYFCILDFVVLLFIILTLLLFVTTINLICSFYCMPQVLELNQRIPQCWRVLLLFLLVHIVCICLLGIQPCQSSSVSSYFGPSVEVPSLYNFSMALRILQEGLAKCFFP